MALGNLWKWFLRGFTGCRAQASLTRQVIPQRKVGCYMAAFLRQIIIRVLTLTSRKGNEKIKIYGGPDYQGAPEPRGAKKVAETCREYGISEQTFYNYRGKKGGISLSELQG